MADSSEQPVWYGWELARGATCYRACYGTYDMYWLKDLPNVTHFQQLEGIKVPADIPDKIKGIIEAVSDTSCFFESLRPGMHDFFHDQQDCVIWCFDPDTGHVTVGSRVVAHSLPE